jgi:hypothetical protein
MKRSHFKLTERAEEVVWLLQDAWIWGDHGRGGLA